MKILLKRFHIVSMIVVIAALLVSVPFAAHAQSESPLTASLDPGPVVEWMELLRARVWAETINPAASARIYSYAGITAYESLNPGMPAFRSLAFQVNDLPELPYWNTEEVYDWLSTNNAAMHTVLNGLLFDKPDSVAAFDALYEEQVSKRLDVIDEDIVNRSLEFGDELGNALLDWISNDGYKQAREDSPNYVLPTAEEMGLTEESDYLYVRTNTERPIVEPYFGNVRPIGVDNRYDCIFPNNVPFSIAEDSAYYLQAMETFEVGNNLTPEQREIAEFWIDTPGVSSTPAGHWVSIANQMVTHLDLTLDRAAMMYGMLGTVLMDSFVVGFGIKYDTLTIRPQSYINRHISQRWSSYLVTPQFPEYPSNHSIVSVAAADMLTSILGIVPFEDHTAEESLGYVRSFLTFEQAADEAAISRLYGGIHYRTSIENGKRIGRCITQSVLNRIVLNPIEQGE